MLITMKGMFSIRMPIMGPSKWGDIDVTPTGLVSFPETWFYRDVTPTGQGYVYDYRSTEMSPLRGWFHFLRHGSTEMSPLRGKDMCMLYFSTEMSPLRVGLIS